MLVPALVAFFRYRVVRSIFVLACWTPFEQMKFIREISYHGYSSTFVCNTSAVIMEQIHRHGLQGVVYFTSSDDAILRKMNAEVFSGRYVWMIVGAEMPTELNQVRYDAEMALLRIGNTIYNTNVPTETTSTEVVYVEDIYVHPSAGAMTYPWAEYSAEKGLQVEALADRARTLRRLDFQGYPMKIAAPVGHYSQEWYNGSYAQYVVDEALTELDGGIRSGYIASHLLLQLLNATEVLITTELWGATIHNSSMALMLLHGRAELSGAILRILLSRIGQLDYVVPIWPFNVGFTYLSERESSSNMFVSPFTARVWWACAGLAAVLCAALRVTARSREEKDDACCSVLATCLQQDASAVPKGLSGRWTFTVLSICAMLVHAYYTSAIVSALMSAGSGGPETLRALADSKYDIASEDYDYMRYLFFDVETSWDDLEYLKRKKKTSKFYQELEHGVQLIQEGSTAFHSEYNQIYPHFKTFSDDQICKLQHVDTIPQVMTWITATPYGQFTNTFRAGGAWLHEVGLGRRLVVRLQALRPPCRAQLLAERVNFGDVAPLLALTLFGAVLSVILLGLEILISKSFSCRNKNRSDSITGTNSTEADFSD